MSRSEKTQEIIEMEISKEIIIELIKKEIDLTTDNKEFISSVPLKNQGIDSLDRLSIFLAIEENFDTTVPDEDYERLRTIDDIVAYLEEKDEK